MLFATLRNVIVLAICMAHIITQTVTLTHQSFKIIPVSSHLIPRQSAFAFGVVGLLSDLLALSYLFESDFAALL